MLVLKATGNVIPFIIPFEQMPVALGHGMSPWNMSHETDAGSDLTGMAHLDESLSHLLRPNRGETLSSMTEI